MNILPRKFALTIAVAVSITTLGACRDDTSKPVGDVLAQDSTLDLAVMTAGGDSAGQASSDTPVAMMSTPVATSQSAPAPRRVPAPVAVKPTATVRQVAVAPAARRMSRPVAARKAARARRRATRLIRSEASRSETQSTRVSTVYRRPAKTSSRSSSSVAAASEPALSPGNTVVYSKPETITRATSAVIPSGSSLSLVTDSRICTSSAKVGDRFNARLTKQVVGPSGVMIPEGNLATGEIISLPGDDSRMRVSIRSIEYNGRSYAVGSQTSYTDMQSVKMQPAGGSASRVLAGAGIGAIIGRVIGGNTRSTMIGAAGGAVAGGVIANRSVKYDQCVPSGGQIIAHLTQPLRVDLGE